MSVPLSAPPQKSKRAASRKFQLISTPTPHAEDILRASRNSAVLPQPASSTLSALERPLVKLASGPLALAAESG